jgi:hypothetical protein
MPFYELAELEKQKSKTNSKIESGAVPGEFMNSTNPEAVRRNRPPEVR